MNEHTQPKRDGRATRIPAEPEAEKVTALLAEGAATRGQRQIITRTLNDLSGETGVNLCGPEGVRAFYLAAAYRIGAARPRHQLREILQLIAEGETFDNYKEGDHLWHWKAKRMRRNHSSTKSTAAELAKRLSDPQTPDDYRAALKRALGAFCDAAEVEYDEQDPAGSCTEASAEGEVFQVTTAEWRAALPHEPNVGQDCEAGIGIVRQAAIVRQSRGGESFSGSALAVYADAVAAGEPATKNLYFDISGAWSYGKPEETQEIVARIRQIGIGRILRVRRTAT